MENQGDIKANGHDKQETQGLTRRKSLAELNLQNQASVPFYKIVLTGGPCGGKTTALARVSSYLRERGFEIGMTPEVFTILMQNGLSLDFFATEGMDLVIQTTVLNMQESIEDGMEQILKARGKPAVLLCDRGTADGAAYMTTERFQELLDQQGKSMADVRECRYNAVFHMVTAAEGAEEFYTLENNEARTESPEEARVLDQSTQRAWVGHPYLVVLDNSTDFEGKLQRLVEATAKLVGLPTNLSRYTAKFLLKEAPDLSLFTVDYHIFDVEKVYLIDVDSPGDNSKQKSAYTFIRKRTHVSKTGQRTGGSVYGLTTVQKTGEQIIEKKRIINGREYASSLKQRDLLRHIVKQKRIAFLYKHQSFNIHMYEEPVSDLCILHAQVETANEGELQVELPPFLQVERRLEKSSDDEQRYGGLSLSLMSKQS